jgi:hypothetical protein
MPPLSLNRRFRECVLAAPCLIGVSATIGLHDRPALAQDPDCANPNRPVTNTLARVIESAARTCGCALNISHTLCSRHGTSAAHSEGRAADINTVNGEAVGPDNEAAKRLQEILQQMSAVEENLGPFVRERAVGHCFSVAACKPASPTQAYADLLLKFAPS